MHRWILGVKKFFFSFWKSPNLIFHSLFKLLLRGWAFADPSSTTLRTQELVFLATIYIAPVMFILFLALWQFRKKTLFLKKLWHPLRCLSFAKKKHLLFILFIADITVSSKNFLWSRLRKILLEPVKIHLSH